MSEYVFYSSLSCLVVGLHLLSLKLLSYFTEYWTPIVIFAIVTMIISRFLIYTAMSKTDNPTNVHIILNMSVFVTFMGALFFLKLDDFDIMHYILGLVFIMLGIVFIQTSYTA